MEIEEKIGGVGQVKEVKVLGAIGLLDEGETDWKVLVIDTSDPLSSKLNDIDDIEKFCPGLLAATVDWFRIYKIPDGKPPNQFAFNGQVQNKAFAMEIIEEGNRQWKLLVNGPKNDAYTIETTNTSVAGSPHCKDIEAPKADPLPDLPVDDAVHKFYYITEDQRI